MLTSPLAIEREGMINPKFTDAELAARQDLCSRHEDQKRGVFKAHTVHFAAHRARQLQPSTLATGPDIAGKEVSSEEAAALSVPLKDLTKFNRPAGDNDYISGKCVADSQYLLVNSLCVLV
jgi:hypothetical protein